MAGHIVLLIPVALCLWVCYKMIVWEPPKRK